MQNAIDLLQSEIWRLERLAQSHQTGLTKDRADYDRITAEYQKSVGPYEREIKRRTGEIEGIERLRAEYQAAKNMLEGRIE